MIFLDSRSQICTPIKSLFMLINFWWGHGLKANDKRAKNHKSCADWMHLQALDGRKDHRGIKENKWRYS